VSCPLLPHTLAQCVGLLLPRDKRCVGPGDAPRAHRAWVAARCVMHALASWWRSKQHARSHAQLANEEPARTRQRKRRQHQASMGRADAISSAQSGTTHARAACMCAHSHTPSLPPPAAPGHAPRPCAGVRAHARPARTRTQPALAGQTMKGAPRQKEDEARAHTRAARQPLLSASTRIHCACICRQAWLLRCTAAGSPTRRQQPLRLWPLLRGGTRSGFRFRALPPCRHPSIKPLCCWTGITRTRARTPWWFTTNTSCPCCLTTHIHTHTNTLLLLPANTHTPFQPQPRSTTVAVCVCGPFRQAQARQSQSTTHRIITKP
jgi:hypothetical protein